MTHDWETGDIIFDGRFTLSYQYNLWGELKKITDATNMSINYAYDSTGRLSGVTGSDNLFMGVSNYASNFQYRAWGGLKAMTDGSNHTSSLLYNSKLQPTHFDISGNVVSQNYDYNNDGRISFVHNTTDAKFDRLYSYDHAARLSEAKTGGQARGDTGASPYYETFGYDTFSNLTGRQSNNWAQEPLFDGAAYTNNRRSGWGYDADGRDSTIGTRTYTYDADGQMTLMTGQKWVINHYVNTSQSMGYDGDGDKVKEVLAGQATYYLRSSVLDDAIIAEINSSAQKSVGYVYAEGQLLAKQTTGQYGSLLWKHTTPAGTSQFETSGNSSSYNRIELDPMGADVGLEAPNPPDTNGGEGEIGANHIGGIMDARWSNFFDLSAGCSKEGVAASCSGVTSPDGYMEGQMRSFFGDRWYDLPGHENEIERAERAYARDVYRIFAEYRAAQAAKKKPKPTLKNVHHTQQDAEEARRRNVGVGKDELVPLDPAVIKLVNDTLSTQPCIDFFTTILQGVSNNGNPVLDGGNLRQIFTDFLNQPKPHALLTRQMPAGSWGYGNPIGNIRASTAAIYAPGNGATVITDATAIVSEIFHLAASKQQYSDKALAEAAHNSKYGAAIGNYVKDPGKIAYNIPESQRTLGDYSIYFHYLQYNICNTSPGSTHGIR